MSAASEREARYERLADAESLVFWLVGRFDLCGQFSLLLLERACFRQRLLRLRNSLRLLDIRFGFVGIKPCDQLHNEGLKPVQARFDIIVLRGNRRGCETCSCQKCCPNHDPQCAASHAYLPPIS